MTKEHDKDEYKVEFIRNNLKPIATEEEVERFLNSTDKTLDQKYVYVKHLTFASRWGSSFEEMT